MLEYGFEENSCYYILHSAKVNFFPDHLLGTEVSTHAPTELRPY